MLHHLALRELHVGLRKKGEIFSGKYLHVGRRTPEANHYAVT